MSVKGRPLLLKTMGRVKGRPLSSDTKEYHCHQVSARWRLSLGVNQIGVGLSTSEWRGSDVASLWKVDARPPSLSLSGCRGRGGEQKCQK